MRFTTKILLASLMAACFLFGQAHESDAKNPECRGFGLETQRSVRRTIWCVSNKLGIPGGAPYAVRIADRETNLGQDETNDASGACGIFQHYPSSSFYGRYSEFMQNRWQPAPRSCYNDRANIIVSLTMVNRGGWGPWGG